MAGYVHRRTIEGITTVAEASDLREACKLVPSYQQADPNAKYYASRRPTSNWLSVPLQENPVDPNETHAV